MILSSLESSVSLKTILSAACLLVMLSREVVLCRLPEAALDTSSSDLLAVRRGHAVLVVPRPTLPEVTAHLIAFYTVGGRAIGRNPIQCGRFQFLFIVPPDGGGG